jgi:hypothetical protein
VSKRGTGWRTDRARQNNLAVEGEYCRGDTGHRQMLRCNRRLWASREAQLDELEACWYFEHELAHSRKASTARWKAAAFRASDRWVGEISAGAP